MCVFELRLFDRTETVFVKTESKFVGTEIIFVRNDSVSELKLFDQK